MLCLFILFCFFKAPQEEADGRLMKLNDKAALGVVVDASRERGKSLRKTQ